MARSHLRPEIPALINNPTSKRRSPVRFYVNRQTCRGEEIRENKSRKRANMLVQIILALATWSGALPLAHSQPIIDAPSSGGANDLAGAAQQGDIWVATVPLQDPIPPPAPLPAEGETAPSNPQQPSGPVLANFNGAADAQQPASASASSTPGLLTFGPFEYLQQAPGAPAATPTSAPSPTIEGAPSIVNAIINGQPIQIRREYLVSLTINTGKIAWFTDGACACVCGVSAWGAYMCGQLPVFLVCAHVSCSALRVHGRYHTDHQHGQDRVQNLARANCMCACVRVRAHVWTARFPLACAHSYIALQVFFSVA